MTKPNWMAMADPIHGMIRLKRQDETHRLLLDVINSRAFQRLRRIKQMGMAEFVFPGATHNRFVHSIGAMWLMLKTIDHLSEDRDVARQLKQPFADTGVPFKRLLLVGILVHDIGHPPLSHTLEDVLNLQGQGLNHDQHWNDLVLKHDPQLKAIWAKYGHPNMPDALARFLGNHENTAKHYFADLVSSQLDMDRLDYLLRDSHHLGVQYGRVETERLITNLSLEPRLDDEPVIAIREEALPALEHYLFGRYQAYKMALHSLDKAAEILMKKTLLRFAEARRQGIKTGEPADILFKLIEDGKSMTPDEFLMLDDCYLWDKINQWAHLSEDKILKKLSIRLLEHNLFKYIEITQFGGNLTHSDLMPIYDQLRQYYEKRGLSYEFGFDQMIVTPKPFYQKPPVKNPIWIRQHNGTICEFDTISSLPFTMEHNEGRRWLLFVWDREAKSVLKRLLEQRFDPDSQISDESDDEDFE
ncbi:MAG: HD domain-containing protein [Vampirovibrionales bacterium]